MTLFTLAVRNIRHELRRYIAFFLSASLSVWMFYLFASLLFHPDMSPERVPNMLLGPLQAVTGIIAIFAVLFILYAQSSFLKLRQKELGIYTVLGMLPGQSGRILLYENMTVGVAAIAAGTGFGTVCLKLLFLGVGQLLRLEAPLAFQLSGKGLLWTLALFLAVFAVISLAAFVRLRRTAIADMIRAAAKPKAPPTLAWWKAGLGAASIGTAYGLLLNLTRTNVESSRFLIILGLLLVGTALFFSQGSVALLRLLQHRRSVYYRQTSLFTVSQLVYKVRDNARVLFMVSMLSTLVLVAGGLYYGLLASAARWAEQQFPYNVVLAGVQGPVDADRVAQVLREHGTPPVAAADLPTLAQLTLVTGPGGNGRVYGLSVAPVSGFNQWAPLQPGVPSLAVADGQGVLIKRGTVLTSERVGISDARYQPGPPSAATVGAEVRLTPPPAGLDPSQVLSINRMGSALLVISDETFATLQGRYGKEHGLTLYGFQVADWRKTGPVFRQLTGEIVAAVPAWRNMLESPWVRQLAGTWSWYDNQRQEASIFLFAFMFVAVLFFLVAGNMLYFKLFNDLQDDRRQFQALHKLGMGTEQIRRILSVQTLVIFFAPFVLAVIHASVILQSLGVLLEVRTNLWGAILVVAGVYLALHGAYFLVARRTYIQAVLDRM